MKRAWTTGGDTRAAAAANGHKVGRPAIDDIPRATISASLPPTLVDRLDDAARRMGVSRSEAIARAAEAWLLTVEDV